MNTKIEGMGNDKFITVLTATFGSEIAVIRGRLESEGITCFVKDELTVQVNPFYSNAVGGVELQVPESELNQAIEILKETGYIKNEDLPSLEEQTLLNEYPKEEKEPNDGVKTVCPICGSDEVVQTKKGGWLLLVSSLLFSQPTPFLQKRYYCFECKQEFKRKRKRNQL